jgi:hypothetical protein
MLISFTSVAGSPGVSTAALALGAVWPRQALVAECDPVGGESLALAGEARRVGRRGVRDMLLAARVMPLEHALWNQVIPLPDGTGHHWTLPGLEDPRDADTVSWQSVAQTFIALGIPGAEGVEVDVLADCGRLRAVSGPVPVLGASDLVVLVLRSDLRAVLSVRRAAAAMRAEAGQAERCDDGLVAVLVGAGRPYSSRDVERQLAQVGIPVVGELPWDGRSGAHVGTAGVGAPRTSCRSPAWGWAGGRAGQSAHPASGATSGRWSGEAGAGSGLGEGRGGGRWRLRRPIFRGLAGGGTPALRRRSSGGRLRLLTSRGCWSWLGGRRVREDGSISSPPTARVTCAS